MPNFNSHSLVSTWLIPAELDRQLLSKAMNALSNRFAAPEFIPHITLYSTYVPKDKLVHTKSLVAGLSKLLKPLPLTVSNIKHSEILFKSLFAEFKKNPALDKLHATQRKLFYKYGDYPFNPHLSLMYKILEPHESEKIIKQLQIPYTITFDKLGVFVQNDKKDLMNIPNWEVTIYENKK